MRVVTEFDGSGIYVPFVNVHENRVVFGRTSDRAPLFGVHVDTPQNARKFSDVVVLDEKGDELYLLARAEKEQG